MGAYEDKSSLSVCGTIATNTTWDASNMLVTCDITVNSGITLTIVPGTKVIFKGPYRLTVRGNIKAQGTASDIDIHAKEILRMRQDLNKILASHTGQKINKIQRDTERDFFMSADEAKKYGIIDKVLTRRNDAGEGS